MVSQGRLVDHRQTNVDLVFSSVAGTGAGPEAGRCGRSGSGICQVLSRRPNDPTLCALVLPGEISCYKDEIEMELEKSQPKLRGIYAAYTKEMGPFRTSVLQNHSASDSVKHPNVTLPVKKFSRTRTRLHMSSHLLEPRTGPQMVPSSQNRRYWRVVGESTKVRNDVLQTPPISSSVIVNVTEGTEPGSRDF